MDFSLSSEQRALKESVRRFCEREYDFEKRRKLLSSPEGFARSHWATFAELGWLGAGLSEESGGFGGGAIETALILEEMGRALTLEPFLACVIALQAIVRQASPEQLDKLVAPIVSGETIAALAHSEPMGDGLCAPTNTVAKRRQDGAFLLSGQKSFVLGGPAANLVLVPAFAAGQEGAKSGGVSLFAIDAAHPGIERRDYRAVDGRRVSDFTFNDILLDAEALVGEEGSALPAIESALDHGVIGLCAETVGAMEAALWQTRDYLQTRKQFGAALGSFQALQHRMADMLIETELARSMLYCGLAALTGDDPVERRKMVSAAKVQIGEAAHFVTGQAIQLHGGIGVTEEYSVGHYFKRATLARGLGGSTDSHLKRFVEPREIEPRAAGEG